MAAPAQWAPAQLHAVYIPLSALSSLTAIISNPWPLSGIYLQNQAKIVTTVSTPSELISYQLQLREVSGHELAVVLAAARTVDGNG